jgi:hypothetical protein
MLQQAIGRMPFSSRLQAISNGYAHQSRVGMPPNLMPKAIRISPLSPRIKP